MRTLPFDVLVDIAEFSLHNAIVRLGDRLLHSPYADVTILHKSYPPGRYHPLRRYTNAACGLTVTAHRSPFEPP